jgi:hypothetical protein
MIGALVAGITGSGGASLSSYESIATATGTGSSGTITFSSIPSGFKHLQIRGMSYDNDSGIDNFRVRFNSDSTSSYPFHYLSGNGATTTATGYSAQTYFWGGYLHGVAGGSGALAASIIEILDYTSTTKNKTTRSLSGIDRNGSGQIGIFSSVWLSTNAITSISLINPSYNWNTSTTFALYGIKEA